MSVIEVLMVLVIIAALGCGTFLYAWHGDFIKDMGVKILKAAWPAILRMIPKITEWLAKRNTPEVEKEMAECVRRGGEWDNFNKKCRYR